MKNWFTPLAILGVSGLGLACTSESVQGKMRLFLERLSRGEDPLRDVNKFVDEQLKTIQRTLDSLAEALEEDES